MTRIAVVTGGNRGIGLEVVRQLARRGDTVVMGSRDAAKGARAAAAIGDEHILVRRLDVTDTAGLNELADELADRFGRLDVLVNNAAILYDTWQQASNADLALVREALETNLLGAWQTVLAFLPLLRARDGVLVNAVAKVVRELEQGPAPLAWRRLPNPVEVAWRRDTAAGGRVRSSGGEHVFEIYIRPVSPASRTATQLRTDAHRVAEVMRTLGVVDQSRPLHSDSTASHAVVEVGLADTGRRHWNEPVVREVRGVEITQDGQICVWQSLPRDSMGSLVDEALLASAAADALRFVGQLGIVRSADEVVVAGSLHPLTMLAEGDTSTVGVRSSASMPTYRGEEARTSTANAVTATAA